ncbi:MAG: hypothetical protein RL138_1199, partial [Bacteroidota bacterium]
MNINFRTTFRGSVLILALTIVSLVKVLAQPTTGGGGAAGAAGAILGGGVPGAGTAAGGVKTGPGSAGANQLIKDMNAPAASTAKESQFDNAIKDFIDPDNPNSVEFQGRLEELRKSGVPEDEIQRYLNSQFSGKNNNYKEVFKIQRDLSEEEAKKQQVKALQGLPDYFGKNSSVNTDIYGGTIFSKSSLIFTPVENPVPPDDYKIGPGDVLSITIWGQAEYQNNFVVGKDGSIFPSNIGKVFLKGVSFKNARSLLQQKFSSIVPVGSNIEVTISSVRTIRVNVVGEVVQPGAYSMSAL